MLALPVTIRNVKPIIEAKSVSKLYRAGKVDVPGLTGVPFVVPLGHFVTLSGPQAAANRRSSIFLAPYARDLGKRLY